MKITKIIFGAAVLAAMLVSCAGSKKITEQQVVESAVDAQQTLLNSEKKQMEFDFMFSEALKQRMLGNPQNAVQLLSGCLEIDPKSSTAMYELADIHAGNNDFTSASLLLEKAIEINPGNIWYKQLLAQIYQQTRKFDQAAVLYDQLVKADPENLEYLYSKALMLTNAQKYPEAIETYRVMETKTGINDQISVAIQELYVLNKQPGKAFAEIEKLIQNDPTEPRYYGLMADFYQSQGDKENALKYYNKILELDPESGFVHFSLANFYLENNNPEMSFAETKKGFESKSVELQTKLQLYMMLVSNRDESKLTDEREEVLINSLMQTHPEESMVYTIQTDFLLRKGKIAEGRVSLLKAIELGNNDYMLWERLLFVDNDLQDWTALTDHSKKAVALFPNQPNIYLLGGIANIQLEKYNDAIAVLDEGIDYIVDNQPLKGQFLMLKGEALYKLNKIDEAFKIFDRSIELSPDNFIGLNNYAYYLSITDRDLDKAERMSAKVVQRFPENSTYLDTYAWVLFKKGNYTLAKFYMESALKNSTEASAVMFEHYGDILFMMNKPEEAKEYWEKAVKNGGTSEVLKRKIKENKYISE